MGWEWVLDEVLVWNVMRAGGPARDQQTSQRPGLDNNARRAAHLRPLLKVERMEGEPRRGS